MVKAVHVWKMMLLALAALGMAAALTAAGPARAVAAEVNQPDASAGLSLIVKDQHDGVFHEGTEVRVWRVAEASDTGAGSGSGALVPMGDFANLPVSWDVVTEADARALANTLEAFVMRDGFAATDTALTNSNGVASFPASSQALEPGYYLVLAQAHQAGGAWHRPAASLMQLPYAYEDGSVEYAPVVSLKYEELTGPFDMDVSKVWKGQDSARPEQVRVQLLRDGEVWRTAVLNDSNGWHAAWTGLDPAHAWNVLEEDVPDGYKVSVVKDGGIVAVVNSCEDAPGDDRPSGSEGNAGSGSGAEGSGKLPQTGQLWWPVVALLLAGAVLLAAGISKRMRG